jgi:hypothetical protein
MRCTPFKTHAHEMHAHKMHAHEMHAYEMHAHKTHTREICAHEMHELGRCGVRCIGQPPDLKAVTEARSNGPAGWTP